MSGQRWTIHRQGAGLYAIPGPIQPHYAAKNLVEVMPVAENERLREAAQAVDGAARSFQSSLPYQPPEALYDMYREKLAGPLDALRAALAEVDR